MRVAEKNNAILLTGAEVTRFAWPGGYPVFYVTHDSGVLCPKCVDENFDQCCAPEDHGWFVTGHDTNWEDPHLYCDHCNSRIESAYAEEETS